MQRKEKQSNEGGKHVERNSLFMTNANHNKGDFLNHSNVYINIYIKHNIKCDIYYLNDSYVII